MTEQLKPLACPFCGGEATSALYEMKCVNAWCQAQPSVTGGNEAEAITAWNTRAVPVGMVLVPLEPSEAMLKAAEDFEARGAGYLHHLDVPYLGTESGDSPKAWGLRVKAATYRAMIAAAQSGKE